MTESEQRRLSMEDIRALYDDACDGGGSAPVCDEICRHHDGKRCGLLGYQAPEGAICTVWAEQICRELGGPWPKSAPVVSTPEAVFEPYPGDAVMLVEKCIVEIQKAIDEDKVIGVAQKISKAFVGVLSGMQEQLDHQRITMTQMAAELVRQAGGIESPERLGVESQLRDQLKQLANRWFENADVYLTESKQAHLSLGEKKVLSDQVESIRRCARELVEVLP